MNANRVVPLLLLVLSLYSCLRNNNRSTPIVGDIQVRVGETGDKVLMKQIGSKRLDADLKFETLINEKVDQIYGNDSVLYIMSHAGGGTYYYLLKHVKGLEVKQIARVNSATFAGGSSNVFYSYRYQNKEFLNH